MKTQLLAHFQKMGIELNDKFELLNTKMAVIKQKANQFYKASLEEEPSESQFFPEYSIILKTIDAVNSFNALYKTGRFGAKGPSTHEQQDLYRAMLVFACAGLDIFVKQLIKTKLIKLIDADKKANDKFREYVRRDLKKKETEMLNVVAFALIDKNPRNAFLNEYLDHLTTDSLQSVDQLCKVSEASGLETNKLFTNTKKLALKEAFHVRNEIIHEMDINVDNQTKRNTGYRTRRQRKAGIMEKHTKSMLDLACGILIAYKNKYKTANLEDKKARNQ